MQDDATLDFISEHIDMLNDRLERRGYHLNAEMKVKETPMPLKEDILPGTKAASSEGEDGEGAVIAAYRFDVRA